MFLLKRIGFVLLLIVAFNGHAQTLGTDSAVLINPPDFGKLSYEEADRTIYAEERKPVSSASFAKIVPIRDWPRRSNLFLLILVKDI
jgi:hypothetical protein